MTPEKLRWTAAQIVAGGADLRAESLAEAERLATFVSEPIRDRDARGAKALADGLALVARGDISVDAEGRVWRHVWHKNRRPCEPRRADLRRSSSPYHWVQYYLDDGTRSGAYAHRLVWSAFVWPIPAGLQVNHIDGNKGDSRLDNIELVSQIGNMRHAHDVLGQKGVTMNDDSVRELRSLRGCGSRILTLAARYGISKTHVHRILRGDSWANVA